MRCMLISNLSFQASTSYMNMCCSCIIISQIAKRLASSSQNSAEYVAEWVRLALHFRKPVASSSYQTATRKWP